MMQNAEATRRFRVHARHIDGHHARLLDETSFEAAAVAYMEDFHLQAPGDEHEIKVIVRDEGNGHEHCFRVDLDSGETSPCG